MENFGKLCFILLGLLMLSLLGGFVFMTLWDWFIVTTFQARTINLPQAIGLVLIVGYLKPKTKKEDDDLDMEKVGKSFLTAIFMAGCVLGIGWIVTLFL